VSTTASVSTRARAERVGAAVRWRVRAAARAAGRPAIRRVSPPLPTLMRRPACADPDGMTMRLFQLRGRCQWDEHQQRLPGDSLCFALQSAVETRAGRACE
jgi:hypothetical protein